MITWETSSGDQGNGAFEWDVHVEILMEILKNGGLTTVDMPYSMIGATDMRDSMQVNMMQYLLDPVDICGMRGPRFYK